MGKRKIVAAIIAISFIESIALSFVNNSFEVNLPGKEKVYQDYSKDPNRVRLLEYDSDWGHDDNLWYHVTAINLIEGNGFSARMKPPYYPTAFRPPLYVYFLYFVYKHIGIKSLFLIQIFVFALSLISFALCLYFLFGSVAAFTGLCIIAFDRYMLFGSLNYLKSILLVHLFYFLVPLLTIYFLKNIDSLREKKLKILILSATIGLLLGLLTLNLSEFFFLAIPYSILLFYFVNRKSGLKKAFAVAGMTIFVGYLTVLPSIIRNYEAFGVPVLSGRGGALVWLRGELARNSEITKRPEEVYEWARVNINNVLHAIVYDEYLKGTPKFGNYMQYEHVLQKKGIDNILKYPFGWLSGIKYQLKYSLYGNPTKLGILGSNSPEDNFLKYLIFPALVLVGIAAGIYKNPLSCFLAVIVLYYMAIILLISVYSGGVIGVVFICYAFLAYLISIPLSHILKKYQTFTEESL